ncbi:MAG: PKD domain-containing protein [Bacteroidia bacterium]|nr:PKD domain-containing protein [Bacteroidia bacterium]
MMMRLTRYILATSALLMPYLTGFAAAPPLLEWQRCMGGTGQDMPVRLIKGNDGYIYTLGSSSSNDGDVGSNKGSLDIWLTKQDSLGSLVWQKSYGGSNMDIGTGIVQLPGGEFIVAGYTSSNNGDVSGSHGNFDAWLIKLDIQGNIIWQKTIGGSQVDLCYSLILLQDGGYLLAGGTYSNDGDVAGNHGDQDFWLVKTSSNGTILWQQSLGGSALDVCYAAFQSTTGEIYACGTSNSTDGDVVGEHGSFDSWIVKCTPGGQIIWTKCFGGSDQESALGISQGNSNQFVFAGYSKSSDGDVTGNFGYNDYWVCKVDENGILLDEKNFGGSGADIAYSIIQTLDGGFLITGGTNSSDFEPKSYKGAEDISLVKTDATFNVEWKKNYGGTGNDRPSCSFQNADGGFYIAAYTYSNDGDITGNHGTSDYCILKLSCKVPQVAFVSTEDSLCIGNYIQLINSTLNASSYSWSLNQRFISEVHTPSIQLTRRGQNTIRLTSETCYFSDSKQVTVYVSPIPVPHILQSEAYLCAGSEIEISSDKAGTYNWSTGENSHSIKINHGGNYTLDLTIDGCTGTTWINITEHATPIVNLGNDTTLCPGAALVLYAPVNMQSYLWQDGSTMPALMVSDSGTYEVQVTNQYCSSTDQIRVSLSNCGAPTANFTASSQSVCVNGSLDFLDLSGNASEWLWTFPGGTPATSNLQNPSVTYSVPGTYGVMLVATNAAGSNILMRQMFIVVKDNPAKPIITVNGNNLSSTLSSSYQWLLNQLSIPSATGQMHTALHSGTYQVQIHDENGCSEISDPTMILVTGIGSVSAKGNDIKVYPNPTYDDVNLDVHETEGNFAEIRLIDTRAALVHTERIVVTNGLSKHMLDLSELPAGTYFLEYRSESGKTNGSILIKQ